MKKLSESFADKTVNPELLPIIIEKLKNALKEEFNAWYGYIIVKEYLCGLNRKDVEKFYDDTAKDELEDHGYWLMKRINELGGIIDDIANSPASWLTAKHTYISPNWVSKYDKSKGIENDNLVVNIKDSIEINIKNELGAIETYNEIIDLAKQANDYITERKCKEILADEQEHLQELEEFLDDIISNNNYTDTKLAN